jgi:hypothetical protein
VPEGFGMVFSDIIRDVPTLSRLEKIHLIQVLARELERDEAALIEPGQSYPLWSPTQAFQAAATMLQVLENERSNP